MWVLAPVVFISLFFISAPYGRHTRQGWGSGVDPRVGWLVMEAPASLIMLAVFFILPLNVALLVMLLLWQCHYFHRAFIYPFTLRGARAMPLSVVAMALLFNLVNGYLMAGHFVFYGDRYDLAWLTSINFIVGTSLFVGGYMVAKHSDHVLRNLRNGGEGGYKIPYGGVYRYVSCPNYLGEIIQWGGWALLTFSEAGLLFFFWTIANLAPRAISHHRWYVSTFEDYPAGRRALIPFVV